MMVGLPRRCAAIPRRYARAMPLITDSFDLGGLRLTAGEGRRLDLAAGVDPFELGSERYRVEPVEVPIRLDVSRTTGGGYALRLRFTAGLAGACMRCLEPAAPEFEVDAREVFQPGAGEELDSPYLDGGVLALLDWVRDSLALTLPATVLCRPDCRGLCPGCGGDLIRTDRDHA